MNDHERQELEQLKQMHALLKGELLLLGKRLATLESRARTVAPDASASVATLDQATAVREMARTPLAQESRPQEAGLTVPPIIAPASQPQSLQGPASAHQATSVNTVTLISAPVPASTPQPARADSLVAPPKASFELRLGTYWLVRIGVVMVLTALVFFGNLAYQNFISKLGPGGKIALLYLASFAMMGAGAWWLRKTAKESLKNYAQVLFAGGLAGGYFTTYAAHHFPNLHVIGSAWIDGVLLLGWAGFMVWIADRKKSEVMAIFAVLLAYYSSVITRVGMFTLYSNALLAAAAVFFLVKNRWAALSSLSLVATYISYLFWRFVHGFDWQWAYPGEGLWGGIAFLASYWILFSAAVFLSRSEKLAGPSRAGFLTLNNGAFLCLFLLTLWQVREGGLWKVLIIFGAVLLALSEAARRFLASEPAARNAYLVQGLVLVTAGLIARYSGLHLALLLAAESVVLLALSFYGTKDLVLRGGSFVAAGLAVAWALGSLERLDNRSMILGLGVGAMMLANAVLSRRREQAPGDQVRATPLYFSAASLVLFLAVTFLNSSRQMFPLLVSVEGVVLTASIYLLAVPELCVLGQGYLIVGAAAWLLNMADGAVPPWWSFGLVLVINLGLSHWWQRQKIVSFDSSVRLLLRAIYAAAIIGMLYAWLPLRVQRDTWIALASLVGLGLTAYGIVTRAWLLALFAQFLTLVGVIHFAGGLLAGRPAWYFTLVPMGVLLALSYWATAWFQSGENESSRFREPVVALAEIYRWATLVMSIWWLCEYFPARHRFWILVLANLVAFAWAGWRWRQQALPFSGAYLIAALFVLWFPLSGAPTVSWLNLCALIAIVAQQRVARELTKRFALPVEAHNAAIVAVSVSLWLFVSRLVLETQSGFYLTASWSLLALVLFTLGILFRERVYRWVGLAILGCALGRVVLFDVWKLETLYRILSFLALGIVLLVLGFIYNRYQDKIRQWL